MVRDVELSTVALKQHNLSQALAEVIEARIWGGIHTRSADVQGAKIGTEVVAYMTAHYFKPLR